MSEDDLTDLRAQVRRQALRLIQMAALSAGIQPEKTGLAIDLIDAQLKILREMSEEPKL